MAFEKVLQNYWEQNISKIHGCFLKSKIEGATENYQESKSTSSRRFGTAARLPRSRCGSRLDQSLIINLVNLTKYNTSRLWGRPVPQSSALAYIQWRLGKHYSWLCFFGLRAQGPERCLSFDNYNFVIPFQYASISADSQQEQLVVVNNVENLQNKN